MSFLVGVVLFEGKLLKKCLNFDRLSMKEVSYLTPWSRQETIGQHFPIVPRLVIHMKHSHTCFRHYLTSRTRIKMHSRKIVNVLRIILVARMSEPFV